MSGIVVIFDFDKTIIDIDSDNWVVDELGATDLFNRLLRTMPWNSVMKKDMFKWKKENGEYGKEKKFESFSKTIKSEFKKDPKIKNMKDLEMTIKSEFIKDPEMKNIKDLEMEFFTIIAHEHYYLVVFNFLKDNTVIIGNSKTKMTYDAKYKTVCELLKKLFSMHLEKLEHPRAKDVLNKKATISGLNGEQKRMTQTVELF
nr:ulp1 protease family, C-terminal catalytic domain-containing protein [Tanacetum cinerariifolium]